MSRRRYLSTDISLDVELAKLGANHGDLVPLLYTWGIVHADDDAVLYGGPEKVLYKVFPARRDLTPEHIEGALQLLHDADLIIWSVNRDRFQYRLETFYRIQSYIREDRRRTQNIEGLPKNGSLQTANFATNSELRYKQRASTKAASADLTTNERPGVAAASVEPNSDSGPNDHEPASPTAEHQRTSPQTAKFAANSELRQRQRTSPPKANFATNSANITYIDKPISEEDRGNIRDKSLVVSDETTQLPPTSSEKKWSREAVEVATRFYDLLKDRQALPSDKNFFGRQAAYAEQMLKHRSKEEIIELVEWAIADPWHGVKCYNLRYVDTVAGPQYALSKTRTPGAKVAQTTQQTSPDVLAEIERNAPRAPQPDDEDVPF